MTRRDRISHATKALLFGLQMEVIRNVLALAGDPIPCEDRQEVKGALLTSPADSGRHLGI